MKSVLLPLACVALVSCQSEPAELTLDQAIARNVEARGGAEALDRIESQRIDVTIEEGDATYQGRYAANSDGLVRIDIYVDGNRIYSEGIDEDGVWMRSGDDPAEESKATGARNALLHGAEDHLFGWHRFAKRGHEFALKPAEEVDGREHAVVEIRYKTGHVGYYFLDPKTWLAVRKRDERAYHPDVDPTEVKVESRPGDFIEVEGVTFANSNTDFNMETGEVLASNKVTARTINPELCPTYFDRGRMGPATLVEAESC